jgi:peroxiredoxin
VSTGDRAPDWTLRDIHSQEHRLSDYDGKVVVLDFWATWCAPCLPVSPHMQAIHEKYADRGLMVLGIHYNDRGDPAAYMKEHGFTYPCMVDGLEVAKKYGVSQIPTIMVISPKGEVVHRQTGFAQSDLRQIERVIQQQLQ